MEREQLIAKLNEDLNICEEYLKKEVRLDLVLRILEELFDEIKIAKKKSIPVGDIEEKVRILYHRASTLIALTEEETRR
ncbi:MAG: hypothetical protein NZ929_04625 [Aigarchaeota archaeon]|nr:hypothetical protein [Aigarchaeota archaeon]MCX8193553.1 hypothetical protein [Nitrososphaeria archaeon]MDW7986693.1 hypothetical protein [Nitrososphaerota archaeon]